MKKIATVITTGLMVLAFSSTAFASTAVSEMARNKGVQTVAQCAQTMDKGVSECTQNPTCNE
ncbi:hypothetical protein [Desulfosporosinus nitroreducens]|uniref:Uncharacterized protein n=1 Tax=Desulfosporosinus nitroreducens TaxID=2018668 RepID=A0ABT8QRQ5_9FIRM|nr:hypothetical protein [Desulfosporosinus nitroreducens]MCO1603349.1 hypothetical protein [Desulfosporosinus nitroreducens]MDO0823189.1 hypothetical protein [Desulfosporosinus nitroreducens]